MLIVVEENTNQETTTQISEKAMRIQGRNSLPTQQRLNSPRIILKMALQNMQAVDTTC